MLTKLFGPKTKEIKDYKHQIWSKWFTCDPPKQSHIQSIPVDIARIYSQIGETYIPKQQLSQKNQKNDEEFLANLFKLDQPLNLETTNLIKYPVMDILNDLKSISNVGCSPLATS